jgi:hypothetical protein
LLRLQHVRLLYLPKMLCAENVVSASVPLTVIKTLMPVLITTSSGRQAYPAYSSCKPPQIPG